MATVPSYVTAWIQNHWQHAVETGKKYDISPIIILAQGALESDWGRSFQAVNNNNFFGLTVGSGLTNAFSQGPHWKKEVYTSAKGLKFRKYSDSQSGFMDFGYFIRNFASYASVRPYTQDLQKYVEAIAKSKYISEANGDNRELYKAGILARAKLIAEAVTGKKSSSPLHPIAAEVETAVKAAGFGIL